MLVVVVFVCVFVAILVSILPTLLCRRCSLPRPRHHVTTGSLHRVITPVLLHHRRACVFPKPCLFFSRGHASCPFEFANSFLGRKWPMQPGTLDARLVAPSATRPTPWRGATCSRGRATGGFQCCQQCARSCAASLGAEAFPHVDVKLIEEAVDEQLVNQCEQRWLSSSGRRDFDANQRRRLQ